MSKNVTKLLSPRVLCTSITNRILRWFDRFTTFYYCMSNKLHKTHYSTCSVQKYHKACSWADLTALRLITTVWTKMSQNSYLHEFCAQVWQIVFLADLTVLRLCTTVWASMSQIVIFSTCSVQKWLTKRVLSWFDRFTTSYYCTSKKCTQNSYLHEFCAQVSQILFLI